MADDDLPDYVNPEDHAILAGVAESYSKFNTGAVEPNKANKVYWAEAMARLAEIECPGNAQRCVMRLNDVKNLVIQALGCQDGDLADAAVYAEISASLSEAARGAEHVWAALGGGLAALKGVWPAGDNAIAEAFWAEAEVQLAAAEAAWVGGQ